VDATTAERPRRRSGVFYLRDLVFEGIYRVLEAFGMRFRHRHRGESRFEALLEAFYRRLPLEGAVIVDVGAHFGRHAIPLAELAGPKGLVHAFEPLPIARQVMAERVGLQRLNNVVIYPFAVGAEDGQAEFVMVPQSLEESGLRERAVYNTRKRVATERIAVTVRRLDEVVHEPVRFIKIDVEGGELDVLRGATRILDTHRPIVAFECGAAAFRSYHENSDALFEIFGTRDYVVHALTGIEIPDAARFRQTTEVQEFWDYVAFPREHAGLAKLLSPGGSGDGTR
jgi:FkbM family methyltransferase